MRRGDNNWRQKSCLSGLKGQTLRFRELCSAWINTCYFLGCIQENCIWFCERVLSDRTAALLLKIAIFIYGRPPGANVWLVCSCRFTVVTPTVSFRKASRYEEIKVRKWERGARNLYLFPTEFAKLGKPHQGGAAMNLQNVWAGSGSPSGGFASLPRGCVERGRQRGWVR